MAVRNTVFGNAAVFAADRISDAPPQAVPGHVFFTAADILHRFFVSVGDVRHAFGPIRRQQPERVYLRHAFCRSPHRAAALAVRAYLYRELPVFKPAVALYACRTG